MEVVLTVITLATAIKDMVELAQKIQASFEKANISVVYPPLHEFVTHDR